MFADTEYEELKARLLFNDSLFDDDQELLLESNPFRMPWYFTTIYCMLYVALLVVAVVGNCCVVYVIVKNESMRTVTHCFIVNLSISDTLLVTFNGMFMTIYLMENHWMFGEPYCRVAQFLAPFLISVSIFTYAAMALDRYIAVVFPLRIKPTLAQVALALFGIWMVSAAIATPNFIFAKELYANFGDRVVCTVRWPDGLRSLSDKIYHLFLICVNYVVPLVIMTYTYSKICIMLWGSKLVGEWNKQQEGCLKAKRKLVKMLILCVIIFTLCWAPMHTYQIIVFLNVEVMDWKYNNYLYVIIYLIAMSNAVYPPIIYCQLNARFRDGFASLLRCACCRPSISYLEVNNRFPSNCHSVAVPPTSLAVPSSISPSGKFARRAMANSNSPEAGINCIELNAANRADTPGTSAYQNVAM